ncbi:MAG: orotidine-5'-phosphate decarboxylase [bacterium]|nr:orotidine-5'-phosphate decarboxylase [bacterium]
MGNKIIIALDGMSEVEALRIAKLLKGKVWGFKINDLLFADPGIIKKLKKFGNVFADAKLYDIPNTVANSVRRLSAVGADMITVHASGGIEMMRAAKENAGHSKILAVTVLTSFKGSQNKIVLKLAREAEKAGLDGIVCSGHELKYVSKLPLLKVVPGIRPKGYNRKDDQKRTVTAEEAVKLGADYLVIGRPIINSLKLKHGK